MQKRKLGKSNLEVSAMGLGCMGMSFGFGPAMDKQEGISLIRAAVERGVTFFDTAEIYGPYTNEELVGRAIAGKRAGLIIATKFGLKFNGPGGGAGGFPANVKRGADASLKRPNIDVIDLYYQHRRDPNVPIEETVGAMKELVAAGKIRYLGLSEVGPETLRRANAVHPISALQSEFSLWERGVEAAILPAVRELGIGFVPYSPLGRGYLTGALKVADLQADDWRRTNPRFSPENAAKNLQLVEVVKRVAERRMATPAQIALAWVLAQGNDIAPIPGTKRVRYLEDNVGSLNVRLEPDDMRELDTLKSAVAGERYEST